MIEGALAIETDFAGLVSPTALRSIIKQVTAQRTQTVTDPWGESVAMVWNSLECPCPRHEWASKSLPVPTCHMSMIVGSGGLRMVCRRHHGVGSLLNF